MLRWLVLLLFICGVNILLASNSFYPREQIKTSPETSDNDILSSLNLEPARNEFGTNAAKTIRPKDLLIAQYLDRVHKSVDEKLIFYQTLSCFVRMN